MTRVKKEDREYDVMLDKVRKLDVNDSKKRALRRMIIKFQVANIALPTLSFLMDFGAKTLERLSVADILEYMK